MEHVALAEEWWVQVVSGLAAEGQRKRLHYLFQLNACQWVHMSGVHDRMHARQIRDALGIVR